MEINKNPLFSNQIKKSNEKIKSSLTLSKIKLNKLHFPSEEKIFLKKTLTFNRKNNNNKLSLSTDEKNNNNKKYNIPNLSLYKNINESILNDLISEQSMGTFNININKKNKEKIISQKYLQNNFDFNIYNKKNINSIIKNNDNKFKINKNKRVKFLDNENINNTSINFNKKLDLTYSFNKNNTLNNSNSIYNTLNNSLLISKKNPIKLKKNKNINYIKKFSSKILNANLKSSLDYEKMQKIKNANNFLDTNKKEINEKKIYLRRDSFIDKLILKITNPDEIFEDFVQNEKPEDKYIRFKNHLIKNKNYINKMIQDSILLQRKADNFLLHYNPHINKTKYFLKSKYGLYDDNEDNNNDNKN